MKTQNVILLLLFLSASIKNSSLIAQVFISGEYNKKINLSGKIIKEDTLLNLKWTEGVNILKYSEKYENGKLIEFSCLKDSKWDPKELKYFTYLRQSDSTYLFRSWSENGNQLSQGICLITNKIGNSDTIIKGDTAVIHHYKKLLRIGEWKLFDGTNEFFRTTEKGYYNSSIMKQGEWVQSAGNFILEKKVYDNDKLIQLKGFSNGESKNIMSAHPSYIMSHYLKGYWLPSECENDSSKRIMLTKVGKKTAKQKQYFYKFGKKTLDRFQSDSCSVNYNQTNIGWYEDFKFPGNIYISFLDSSNKQHWKIIYFDIEKKIMILEKDNKDLEYLKSLKKH